MGQSASRAGKASSEAASRIRKLPKNQQATPSQPPAAGSNDVASARSTAFSQQQQSAPEKTTSALAGNAAAHAQQQQPAKQVQGHSSDESDPSFLDAVKRLHVQSTETQVARSKEALEQHSAVAHRTSPNKQSLSKGAVATPATVTDEDEIPGRLNHKQALGFFKLVSPFVKKPVPDTHLQEAFALSAEDVKNLKANFGYVPAKREKYL